MSSRSLNKVQLLGNAVSDALLKYTTTNSAICTFSLATNRSWTTEKGEKKEETEFHRIVAWGKLAEICGQLIKKGSKIYAEGRISSKTVTKDGIDRNYFEIVLEDMILLDSKKKEITEEKEEMPSEEKTPDTIPENEPF